MSHPLNNVWKLITISLFLVGCNSQPISPTKHSPERTPHSEILLTEAIAPDSQEPAPTEQQPDQSNPGEIPSIETRTPDSPKSAPPVFPHPKDFLNEGTYIVYRDNENKSISILNPNNKTHFDWLDNIPSFISISRSGRYLSLGSFDSFILLDLLTNTTIDVSSREIKDYRMTTWSPDENLIVFSAETAADWQSIFLLNINSQDVYRLTPWKTIETEPSWSPDGNWIAFASDQASKDKEISYLGLTEIYLFHADCFNQPSNCISEAKQITGWESVESNGNPSWSPDSKKIVFSCRVFLQDENGIEQKLCVDDIEKQSTEPQPLDLPGGQKNPVWSPNSDWIAFTNMQISGGVEIYEEVYIVNLRNLETINLTAEIEGNQEVLFWLVVE